MYPTDTQAGSSCPLPTVLDSWDSPSYALTGCSGWAGHWSWFLLRQEYKRQPGRSRRLPGHLLGIGMSQQCPDFFQAVTCPPSGPRLRACWGPAAQPCLHSWPLRVLAPAWSQFPSISTFFMPHAAVQTAGFRFGSSASWLWDSGQVAPPLCLSFPFFQMGVMIIGKYLLSE